MTLDNCLAIAGVAIGIYGIWDSRQQRGKLERLVERLDGFATALTTSSDRYEQPVGNEILKMIDGVKKKYRS